MSSCGSAVGELYSCEIISVQHHSWELSKIDLKMAIPNGFYERIAPHSSLSISHSIDVGGGVIDSDFTGIIKIILINHSSHPFSDRFFTYVSSKMSKTFATKYFPQYHCMKKKRFHKNAQLKYHIFVIFRIWRKYHIFRKTKIKENIIFSIISDIFRNKSIKQDNDRKGKIG